jgi:hypothetical protein
MIRLIQIADVGDAVKSPDSIKEGKSRAFGHRTPEMFSKHILKKSNQINDPFSIVHLSDYGLFRPFHKLIYVSEFLQFIGIIVFFMVIFLVGPMEVS